MLALVEDYNIPSAERVALLQRLQEAVGDVPPYFWAACQICDLKTLEKLAECALILPGLVRSLAGQTHTMVLHWTQSSKGSSRTTTPRKQTPSDLGSPASSPLAKKQKTTDSPGSDAASSLILLRNQAAKASAKQRDKFRCILTRNGNVEVAHIYPFHSLKNKEDDIFGPRHVFWNHLKNFWPVEKVAAWEAELFPRGIDEMGLERVCNLITLSRNAHSTWNRGAFALKPISVNNDNTILTVQFFWQKKQKDTQATMSLLTAPFSTEDLDRNEGAFDYSITRMWDINTGKPIKSGDIFELQTDDAIARPLSSFKLLEMQWFLTRIVGMAGAAVPYDEDWGSEDSDDAAVLCEAGWEDEMSNEEISNPGLEESKDDSFALSDPDPQGSPPSPRKGSLLPVKGFRHHTEATTRDGLGDRYGGQEIT